MVRKMISCIRFAMDTHERLRLLKHRIEVETYDEAMRFLLDRYEKDPEMERGEN